jgi:hypothetical protein
MRIAMKQLDNGTGSPYVDLFLRLLREVGFQGVLVMGLLYAGWQVGRELVSAHAAFLQTLSTTMQAQSESLSQIAKSMRAQEELLRNLSDHGPKPSP